MCDRLNEVVASARAVVASLDSLTGTEAARAFESLSKLEKVAAAGKLVLAPKIAQSETWARAGHRTPEEWMARTSGTSVGVARATIETGKRLDRLPSTASIVKSGALSLAQAAAVAEAAVIDPWSESKLLDAAGRESLKVLKETSRRIVLDSRGSLEERYARQRKLREFSSWTDDEGMTAGRFRLTPEVGAAVVHRIKRESDRIFRRAYREGRRETPGNYAADAFAALVTGEGLARGTSKAKGSEVVVLVSREALMRGSVDSDSDEMCEVTGFGAVPVSVARQIMSDAFLKGVVYDGTVVSHVEHFGRHRPAEVDTALLVQAVLTHGEVVCHVEQCDRTAGIQWDHKVPFARGGPTSSKNLHPMCGFDNREKEAGRVVQTADGRWVRRGNVAQRRNPP